MTFLAKSIDRVKFDIDWQDSQYIQTFGKLRNWYDRESI